MPVRKVVCLLALVFLTCCKKKPQDDVQPVLSDCAPTLLRHSSNPMNIIGGERPSTLTSTVMLASKQGKYYQMFCSGTLIARQLVITAAHCLVVKDAPGGLASKSTKDIFVFMPLGPSQVENQKGVTQSMGIPASKIVVHPRYQSGKDIKNSVDLGLVVLQSAAPDEYKTLPIYTGEPTDLTDFAVSLLGYGLTNKENLSSVGTLYMTPAVIRNEAGFISYKTISGTSSCNGDSGGSVVSISDQPVLIGSISGGVSKNTSVKCVDDQENLYGFSYGYKDELKWIRENTGVMPATINSIAELRASITNKTQTERIVCTNGRMPVM